MKSEDLLDAIGNIDDDIIVEAETVLLKRKIPNKSFFVKGALVAACILICIVGAIKFIPNPNDTYQIVSNAKVSEDEFSLVALVSDKQGIDETTGFVLTSKEKIDEKFIKTHLEFKPAKEFEIKKVSSTVYNIIPLSKLDNDTVYQIKISDNSHVHSWAFQTKKEFKIESTIPSNNSTYVPYNSGIEMYFTLSNLDSMEDFFDITPKVEGKFIVNEKCIVFVPSKLDYNTKYTVTIKKGFGIKDSEQKLLEDYVFSFTTQSNPDAEVYFNSPLSNIYEGNKKIIGGFVNNKFTDKEFTINIYQYNSVDNFSENILAYSNSGKFVDNIDNADGLVKINSIKQKPYITDNYYNEKALFELPEDLAKGYYLLEFNIDGEGEKNYHFLQVNDMLIYNASFDNQVLVFASNGSTSDGIKKAEVIINGESLGFTDKDGILVANKSMFNDDNNTSLFMRVKAEGYNDFIYAENYYFYNYYYENVNNAQKYLRYIDTDRPVYLPTDTINVWGFARYRDNNVINKVKIELVEWDTNLVLESKYVDLTDIGTYQTEFELKNSSSEYCTINVYDNDMKISTTSINIMKYTKPLYTLSGELDKKVVFSGDKLNYRLNGNYFDGYPTANTEVNLHTTQYYYNETSYEKMDETFVLDENGETNIDINTKVSIDSWKPLTINISSNNKSAEDKTISTNDSFIVFPKHKMLEIEQNNTDKPQMLDILLHEIDINKFDSANYYSYEKLRSTPAYGKVKLKIIESYNEPVKAGEYYDFINKVNQIKYEYKRIENTVLEDYVNVVNGFGNIDIPNYNEDRFYQIIAEYNDSEGVTIETKYAGQDRYYYDNPSYNIEKTDKDKNYRLNEDVNIELKYNQSSVGEIQNDKMILLIMREGLIDYKVLDNTKPEFKFIEEYIPNVLLGGVYIKNGFMYNVSFYDSLYYDKTEKEIYIDIKADKEKYKPGEEVTLDIDVKDSNNNPCKADVNISVVDEAYFHVFNKAVDTLSDIYKVTFNDGLRKTYLSNIDLSNDFGDGAEMGGGGGYDGVIRDKFKDTSIFKTVTTSSDGKASLKFKLPDNLTSWRITYQGISDKIFAGSGTKNITVSLPFYVDMIMGQEYLKEDKISVSLRSLGSDAKQSKSVEYKLVVKDKNSGAEAEYTKTGIIGEYTNISIDNLNIGEYEVYAYASCGANKDAIKKELRVVDSAIYFANTNYYKLEDDLILDEVYSNPMITLFNESKSDFYNSLCKISTSNGLRIDQTVCSMLATKYINDCFNTKMYYSDEELKDEIAKYKSLDNGYSLLSYANSDVELTAKLANIMGNDIDSGVVKQYFNNILSASVYDTKISAALWGLSKYNEPILLTIYDLLQNNALEIKDKIYLSLALTELGDFETAKKYYNEIAETFDASTNYELTALLSILGVKLQDFDTSDKLFKYIYNNPSKYNLSNFEQLIYIMNRNIIELDEIKDLFGEVTVEVDGVKETYKLKLFDQHSFAVKKEKIKDIKFSNIKGSIACKVNALGNKDDLDKSKTDDFSLIVDYSMQNSIDKQTKFKQSDVVKVTINPIFTPATEEGNYEVTYVIPAGFRFMENGYKDSTYFACANGQKLEFSIYYSKDYEFTRPIVFYMQAAQPGEYTVDYVVIKQFMEEKLNYLYKSSLSIAK